VLSGPSNRVSRGRSHPGTPQAARIRFGPGDGRREGMAAASSRRAGSTTPLEDRAVLRLHLVNTDVDVDDHLARRRRDQSLDDADEVV